VRGSNMMDQDRGWSIQIIQTDGSTVGAGEEQIGVGGKDDRPDRITGVVQQSMILAIRRRVRVHIHIQRYDIDGAILSTDGQYCTRHWIPTETKSQCRTPGTANGPVI
jgi:hypothetical protein